MAGVMVMLGATFVVLSVWDTVSRLRSIESRELIEKFLAGVPGLGLSVEAGIQVAHALAMVSALCAVAAVALGWEVLQRSQGARVALSVVAVPLFLTGLFAGAFASALVAAATVALWLSPSREWFAGEPIPEPAKRPREGMQVWEQTPNRRSDQAPDRAPELGPGHGSGHGPDHGPGQGPDHGPDRAPAPLEAVSPASGWSVSAGAPEGRPGPVTAALVMTFVVASVVFLMTLISLVLLGSQTEVMIEELRRQNPDLEASGVTDSLLLTTSYVTGAIVMLWSVLAMVLAYLTAARRAWAARALMICAAVCGVFCVLAALASPVALIPAIVAIATVSCLRRADVRAWFDAA